MELKCRALIVLWTIFTIIQARPKLKKAVAKNQHDNRPKYSLRSVCPFHTSLENINRKFCMQIYDTCATDNNCGIGMKCCFDGCVYACAEPVLKYVKAIDVVKKPNPHKGNNWKMNVRESQKKVMCSTSNFKYHKPMLCPTGYICDIQRKEDKTILIPNRGFCIEDTYKEIDPFMPQEWTFEDDHDKGCHYKGKKFLDGEHFFNKCNFCFCSNTVINCQTSLCTTTTKKPPKISDNRYPTSDTMNFI